MTWVRLFSQFGAVRGDSNFGALDTRQPRWFARSTHDCSSLQLPNAFIPGGLVYSTGLPSGDNVTYIQVTSWNKYARALSLQTRLFTEFIFPCSLFSFVGSKIFSCFVFVPHFDPFTPIRRGILLQALRPQLQQYVAASPLWDTNRN